MTTFLAKPIKTQILSVLQSLVDGGLLNSFKSLDKNPNPLTDIATAGYPFAIVGMPPVSSDFEDQATNKRTYRYDIMFVLNPEALASPDTGVEDLIDAALNAFDTAFSLNGAAVGATVPPAQVVAGGPITTGAMNLCVFVVRIEARTLYQIGT
jgi:hypothetical protein